jgi:ribosomal protein L29
VAKAAMQTDEAETQLNKLKKEFTAYRMDMEKKVAFQEQV